MSQKDGSGSHTKISSRGITVFFVFCLHMFLSSATKLKSKKELLGIFGLLFHLFVEYKLILDEGSFKMD